MQGVKQTGKTQKSLLRALSEQMGVDTSPPPKLDRYDASSGTYYCETLSKIPDEILREAMEFYESEAVVLRSQAEATLIPSSSQMFQKKATFARIAAQSIAVQLRGK